METHNIIPTNQDEMINQVASFYARYPNELKELSNSDYTHDAINLVIENIQLIESMKQLAIDGKLSTIDNQSFPIKSIMSQYNAIVDEPIKWYVSEERFEKLADAKAEIPEAFGRLNINIEYPANQDINEDVVLDLCDEKNQGASKYMQVEWYDLVQRLYQLVDWDKFKATYPNAIYDKRERFANSIAEQLEIDDASSLTLRDFHRKEYDIIKAKIKANQYSLPMMIRYAIELGDDLADLAEAPNYDSHVHIADVDEWYDKYITPLMSDNIKWAPTRKELEDTKKKYNDLPNFQFMIITDNPNNAIRRMQEGTSEDLCDNTPHAHMVKEAINHESCVTYTPKILSALLAIDEIVDWSDLKESSIDTL